jgi:hypothetical protein
VNSLQNHSCPNCGYEMRPPQCRCSECGLLGSDGILNQQKVQFCFDILMKASIAGNALGLATLIYLVFLHESLDPILPPPYPTSGYPLFPAAPISLSLVSVLNTVLFYPVMCRYISGSLQNFSRVDPDVSRNRKIIVIINIVSATVILYVCSTFEIVRWFVGW